MTRKDQALDKALSQLRQPDAKLVLLHQQRGGCGYFIWPNGGQITNKVAEQILERGDVQPYDNGLLPGHPQSWKLGDWRKQTPSG
jgi:hypothetical protein